MADEREETIKFKKENESLKEQIKRHNGCVGYEFSNHIKERIYLTKMYIIDIIVGFNVGLKLFEELGIKDILAVKLYYCQYIILKVDK